MLDGTCLLRTKSFQPQTTIPGRLKSKTELTQCTKVTLQISVHNETDFKHRAQGPPDK